MIFAKLVRCVLKYAPYAFVEKRPKKCEVCHLFLDKSFGNYLNNFERYFRSWERKPGERNLMGITNHWFHLQEIGPIGEPAKLAAAERGHLFKTLRAGPGTELTLFDAAGTVAAAKVLGENEVLVLSRKQIRATTPKIHLYCAFPRRQRAETMLKQCAELGGGTITPLHAERSVALPKNDSGKERWRKLLIESCKQAKNPYAPEIRPMMKLSAALNEIEQARLAAFYGALEDEGEGTVTIPPDSEIAWLVGPEGGFSPKEIEDMKNHNCHPLRLGPWILRVETAAAVGLGVLRNLTIAGNHYA